MAVNEHHGKRKKRIRRTAVGLIIFALMSLGVFYIISLGVNGINTMLDDTDEKAQYASIISPLVSLDPAPFASLERANQNTLLEAAIWGALYSGDIDSYTRNEEGSILLPSIDVDRRMALMYGPEYYITHQTFTDLDLTFEYDRTQGVYIIPITSMAGSYTPVVERITKTSNTKILTVAYMQSNTSALAGETEELAKYMEYIMLRNGRDYYLYAVRIPELPTGETAQ